jgi:DNA-binding NtrC family response regulator
MPDTVTVLVAEDEDMVRRVVQVCLERAGFRPIMTADADLALSASRQFEGDLQLLLTDVKMPGTLDGIALARCIIHERSGIKVLVMSGKISDPGAVSKAGFLFLAKPFTGRELLDAVRLALKSDPPELTTAA